MIISDTAVKNSTTVYVLALLLIIFGVYCYQALPRESEPDITIPNVFISTEYKGVSSTDIETAITIEIEKKLKGLEGLKKIESVSSEGRSTINVEFVTGTDIDRALQDVKDKVDEAKGDLPSDLEDDPSVFEINLSQMPIIVFSLSGTCGLSCLKEIADDLQDEIEALPGVMEVEINGGLEREIRVEVVPEKLSYYGLTIANLQTVVQSENRNTSGGAIRLGQGRYQLRVPGEFQTPEEIYGLVIGTHKGEPVYLKDVAQVVDGFKEENSISRLNGRDAVNLAIKKRAGENIIAISREVDRIIAASRAAWPQGTEISKVVDKSRDIEVMIADLENNILLRPGPGPARDLPVHGLPQRHLRQPRHPLLDADLLHRPLRDGDHPEHGGPVQPDPGAGHAGRQRHRHRREHLPLHAAGGEPDRGGEAGDLAKWRGRSSPRPSPPWSPSSRCCSGRGSWASS